MTEILEETMDKIGVLDFGGQYAHLIANRVRRMGVYSEIVSPTADLETLKNYKGLIFSGGPSSVYAANAPAFNKEILNFVYASDFMKDIDKVVEQQIDMIFNKDESSVFGK